MEIKTDNFLFMTNSDILNEWEEISPGIFVFKRVRKI